MASVIAGCGRLVLGGIRAKKNKTPHKRGGYPRVCGVKTMDKCKEHPRVCGVK